MRRRMAAVVVAGLLAGVALHARPAEAAAPARSDFTTIQLDAIATDRRGRPVTTLHASDFRLEIDGVLHPLGSVALQKTRRIFGILLDTYHLQPGAATDRVRAAISAFARTQLRPDDLVFVIEPLAPLTRLAPIADPAAIQRTLDAVAGREGDYTPRTDFERKYMGRLPAAVENARTRIVYSALEALTTALGSREGGRRTLIFVSDGRLDGAAVPGVRGLDAVLRAATRFDVAICPLDPDPADRSTPAGSFLASLAARSGGRLVAGPDLATGLAQVAGDADAFYRLTFQAPKADGRFHDVHVQVDRRGVTVRSRPDYWVPSEADIQLMQTSARLREPPPPLPYVRPAHVSGLIRSWFGLIPSADGRMRVTFAWEPDDNAPLNRRDGAAASVELSAKTIKGQSIFDGTVAPSGGDVANDPRAQAVFDAPPGLLELQMKIHAADGKELDADVQHLAIPSVDVRRTILGTPEFFRTRSAREFDAIAGRLDAAPSASRVFSRAEALIIRVRAYAPAGQPVVTARLLNMKGAPMATLKPLAGDLEKDMTQFPLTLSAFPPGDYTIELQAASPAGQTGLLVPFRIVN